ncbi:endoribonuclease dcr-1 [Polyplosphaeria fusca]|uniref:Dicer-like protein 1 n=1 Tax=Polyplosphaeria fusca TaxID=682080 RepID=A0A9P4V413_9PLEO|nr:endoribonuclease dcr-1 [Polyplosphaeria fusca]
MSRSASIQIDEHLDPIAAYEDEEQQDVAADEDNELDVTDSHEPATTSEKRRKTAECTKEEVQATLAAAHDENLSIRAILAKEETSRRIVNPRDYQTELFQRATTRNVIAVLDTGSGKTHIATLLLRHILDLELEARAEGASPKMAFFLVDSVNLVFQQANVLRCGLDQKVEGICGAMGASLWAKPTWDRLFEDNMVIVLTAEVLVQCMMHSFITMAQVNLLIFDEAHHAKSNHAYARLIREYYVAELDKSRRPRIFGMTASPVDANVDDVGKAARDLETLLHSKIVTASDLALLQHNISKPDEEFAKYNRLKYPFETPFYKELKSRYRDFSTFRKYFTTALELSSQLGSWASDFYWSFIFSEDAARKLANRVESTFNRAASHASVAQLDEDTARLREAAEYVQNHDFGIPTPTTEHLSSKVILLHDWLQRYYSRTGEARCIVFVERRYTARLLNHIFSHIGGPHLRSDILVGINSAVGDWNVSLKSQVMSVTKFRKGELNCLFSTSVAEEGLDIPQCNLVIRFDLYRTMIGYVQSRGRARHRNSKYLHMMEVDNEAHRDIYFDVQLAERKMRNYCAGLPMDQRLDGEEEVEERLLAEKNGLPSYTDSESGAKLTYRASLSILAHFVSCLPSPPGILQNPHYIVGHEAGKFVYEVLLPQGSPITFAKGRPYKKKILAKCSAAFEMCLELRKKEHLDANLLPTIHKHLPAMRNALLAVDEKRKGSYKMRIKPEIWQQGYGTIPDKLYLTVIDASEGLDRVHQPLGLLTRVALPQIPRFPIHLNSGILSEIISMPLSTPIPTMENELDMLTFFMWHMFFDIFAKKFEYNSAHMSYWVVPLRLVPNFANPESQKPDTLIDWAQIQEVFEQAEYTWTPDMSNDFLKDRYLVDKWDGSRRFFVTRIAQEYKPHDPVPATVNRPRKFMANILDYSVSLWGAKRKELQWDLTQPVLEVEQIPFRRNLLAIAEKDENEVHADSKVFVCPQPLPMSVISTPFVVMCYALPAIIHRFESYLIALDAASLLGLKVGPALALEALTKDSENSDAHGKEQINFRSGMGPNYERLEFMGDCFLKTATTIAVFIQQPDENEFEYHVRRMCMLCNKNLKETAVKYKLYEFVRTRAFSRRTWYPEGLKLTWGKGLDAETEHKHSLGDKSVADVCEAFIGAAYMQHNVQGNWYPKNWDQAVKAVKVLVDSDDHLMEEWSDYYKTYEQPAYLLDKPTAVQLDMALQVERKHPYHFNNPRLLRSAFIHPSQPYIFEKIPNYERLEFLGDALLDQVFVNHIFYRFPDKDPQWLTEHKMPMVANAFLANICVKLGFHQHIRHNQADIPVAIRDYVTELEEAEREHKGALDHWTHVQQIPKFLGDVVEAFVGAMFVDSEFDFRVVEDFFDKHMKHYFEEMELYDEFAGKHPITRLHKKMERSFGCADYRIGACEVDSLIPGKRNNVAMVLIHNKVYFDSVGESARYAKVRAAHKALEALEGLAPFEFRRLYNCDCPDVTGQGEMEEAFVREFEEAVKEEVEDRMKVEDD